MSDKKLNDIKFPRVATLGSFKVKMLRPKDFFKTLRPPSPAQSVQSVLTTTSSAFLALNLPSSSRVPSEAGDDNPLENLTAPSFNFDGPSTSSVRKFLPTNPFASDVEDLSMDPDVLTLVDGAFKQMSFQDLNYQDIEDESKVLQWMETQENLEDDDDDKGQLEEQPKLNESIGSIPEREPDFESHPSSNESFEAPEKEEEHSDESSSHETHSDTPPEPEDDLFLFHYAPVVTNNSVKLEMQDVPLDKEFNVYLAEIFSPVHFWFHCESEVTELEKKFSEEYNKLRSNELRIKDELIQEGLLVAAYMADFKMWHRALVIHPLDKNDMARLLFVDYGTAGMVHKDNIKYLYKHLGKDYPRYGIRGRLMNLMPFSGGIGWQHDEVEKFQVKFGGSKILRGKVLSFDEKNQIYVLDLNRQKKKTCTNVRDWLLEQHLAASFELQPGSIYPACYHFPTFTALEKDFPSFTERSLMKHDGINHEFMMETNFLTCVNDDLKRNPKFMRMLGGKECEKDKDYLYG